MSRLIKKSIAIPQGVTITKQDGLFVVKGPKGEITVALVPGVTVVEKEGALWIEKTDGLMNAAMLGTTWSLAKNAIIGVTEGFVKKLEIEGVGYRAALEGKDLVLFLGYALPVHMPIPEGITMTVEKNVITISGIHKDAVGEAAAKVRAEKKPEPYKGKGIHYAGEVIRRKVGKKAGSTA